MHALPMCSVTSMQGSKLRLSCRLPLSTAGQAPPPPLQPHGCQDTYIPFSGWAAEWPYSLSPGKGTSSKVESAQSLLKLPVPGIAGVPQNAFPKAGLEA